MSSHSMFIDAFSAWNRYCSTIFILSYLMNFYLQAHNLSKDHKPELEAEKDRILKAGGFIQVGRVNGSLNLARAIGSTNSFLL